jgi:hypothetical protein
VPGFFCRFLPGSLHKQKNLDTENINSKYAHIENIYIANMENFRNRPKRGLCQKIAQMEN